MKKLLWATTALFAGLLSAGLLSAPANSGVVPVISPPTNFSTSGNYITGIGDRIGSGYDILQFVPTTGTLTTNSWTNIGDLVLVVGPNYNIGQYAPVSGEIVFNLMIAGVTTQINLYYNWTSIGAFEYLTFSQLMDTNVGSYVVEFYPLVEIGGDGSNSNLNEALQAQITKSIPEPTLLMLLGVGMLFVGVNQYKNQ